MSTETLQQLLDRTSNPRLVAPAPTTAELEQIIGAGMRAPDHGYLRPTRIHIVSGEGRERLGELFASAVQSEAEANGEVPAQKALDKARRNPLRAPVILVAGCRVQPDNKIPVIEQVSSTAAAVSMMQTAIDALGYASMWRTGAPAYQPLVKSAFGLTEQDHLVAFLYVGSAEPDVRPKKRSLPEWETHVSTF